MMGGNRFTHILNSIFDDPKTILIFKEAKNKHQNLKKCITLDIKIFK